MTTYHFNEDGSVEKVMRDPRWQRSTVCQSCSKEFGRPGLLARHVRNAHASDWSVADGPRPLVIQEEP